MALTFLLDTSVCIEFIRNREPDLAKRAKAEREHSSLNDVVVGELLFGSRKSGRSDKAGRTRLFVTTYEVKSLGLAGGEAYARIRYDLERRGLTIGSNDLLIAATPLAHGATLITRDEAEFSRVPGLTVKGWRQ